MYKPFVSNRIGEIQILTSPEEWRHLPEKKNISDIATRPKYVGKDGNVIPKEWFQGPTFLNRNEDAWPKDLTSSSCTEDVRHVANVITNYMDWDDFKFEFKEDCNFQNITGGLLEALLTCQRERYSTEMEMLEKGQPLPKTSSLLLLTPLLDDNGIMRVGGRLNQAKQAYDTRHPVILPASHPLSEKVVEYFHQECHHAGINYVLCQIRQTFWIIHGREAVKKFSRKCPTCISEKAKPSIQLMSELPRERLAIGRPTFNHTSVDYFGLLEILEGRNKIVKRYGAIFACMTTRAVHLELAVSLSTPDFLNPFSRFTNIRGYPKSMYSDNGTNFVGAEKELRPVVQNLLEDKDLKKKLGEKRVSWKFQPPSAPHWGGVHEALVKSSKKAMYRTLKDCGKITRHLRDDEMRTLLSEVMGLLNSRPLTYVSSDPEDREPLTPNHFLIHRLMLLLVISKH